MIQSKKINIIVAIALIFSILVCAAFVIIGNTNQANGTNKTQAEYLTKIFGTDIISIEILADEDDWKEMLDNAIKEQFIMADVIVNGTKFQNVGIRPKGNSSLTQVASTDSNRYSFRLQFNEYIKDQTCFGLESFVVNNMQGDNTYMKEYISYELMKEAGVDAPCFGYADIKVNGENWGLYLAVELYNDSYEQRVFGDTTGMLYNVKSMDMGGDKMDGKFNPPDMNDMDGKFTPPDMNNMDGQQAPPNMNNADGQPAPPDMNNADGQQAPPNMNNADGQPAPPNMNNADGQLAPPDMGDMDGQQAPPNMQNNNGDSDPQIKNNTSSNSDAQTDSSNAQSNTNKTADSSNNTQSNTDNKTGLNNKTQSNKTFPDFGGKGGPGSSGGSLEYTDDNSDSYSAIFGNVVGKGKESDYQRVIEALKALSEGKELETYFEVDQILKYLAAHTIVVNLDSYSSSMAQNYYIYENDGKITILPWDYNLAWGGFQSGSASSVINFPIDTPVSGVEMSTRPLLEKLFENSEYLEKYHSYLQELIDNYFADGKFEEKVKSLDALISNYVENDSTKFCTYDEYKTAISALVDLGNLRAQSVQGQLDGTVPSTTDDQKTNADALISAGSLKISDLGSMMGGKGDKNNGFAGMGNQDKTQSSSVTNDNPTGAGNQDQTQSSGVTNDNPTGAGNQDKPQSSGVINNNPTGAGNQDKTQSLGVTNNNPTGSGSQDKTQQPGGMNNGGISRELMRQAMDIIRQANGEITDEVKENLLSLGLTSEQIDQLSDMASRRPGGGMGQGRPGDFAPNSPNANATANQSTAINNPILIGVLVLILVAAILFAAKYKKSY